jgi:hypothetical protein
VFQFVSLLLVANIIVKFDVGEIQVELKYVNMYVICCLKPWWFDRWLISLCLLLFARLHWIVHLLEIWVSHDQITALFSLLAIFQPVYPVIMSVELVAVEFVQHLIRALTKINENALVLYWSLTRCLTVCSFLLAITCYRCIKIANHDANLKYSPINLILEELQVDPFAIGKLDGIFIAYDV